MSAGTFIAGLFVLALLLVAPGFGVGAVEFAIWLALIVAWTGYWLSSRRTAERPN